MKLSDHTIFFQSRIKMHSKTQNKTPLATLMYCKCHQLFKEHVERQLNGR
jgi:desulfoferrodoxin (superoxide reductase-like protein)